MWEQKVSAQDSNNFSHLQVGRGPAEMEM